MTSRKNLSRRLDDLDGNDRDSDYRPGPRATDPEASRRLRAIMRNDPDAPITVAPEVREELREIVSPPFSPPRDPGTEGAIEPDISSEAAWAIRVADLGEENA